MMSVVMFPSKRFTVAFEDRGGCRMEETGISPAPFGKDLYAFQPLIQSKSFVPAGFMIRSEGSDSTGSMVTKS